MTPRLHAFSAFTLATTLAFASRAQSLEPLPPPPPPPPGPVAPPPASVPTAPTLSRAGYAPPPAPTLHVTFEDARPNVVLQRRVFGEDDEWRTVCDSPCTEPLAPGTFRIDGDGVVASAPFRLSAGAHTVKVDTGSTGGRVTGIVLTPIGGALMLYGTAFVLLNGDGSDGPNGSGRDSSLDALGVGLLVIGAAVMTTGLVLIGSNRTSVSIDGRTLAADGVRLGEGLTLGANGLSF